MVDRSLFFLLYTVFFLQPGGKQVAWLPRNFPWTSASNASCLGMLPTITGGKSLSLPSIPSLQWHIYTLVVRKEGAVSFQTRRSPKCPLPGDDGDLSDLSYAHSKARDVCISLTNQCLVLHHACMLGVSEQKTAIGAIFPCSPLLGVPGSLSFPLSFLRLSIPSEASGLIS